MATLSEPLGSDFRACFVGASGQNVFFEELSHALRAALERQGVKTEVAVDHFPPSADDLVYVFVPHEYLPLTLPAGHPSDVQLQRTVVLATEQPGTPWFEESASVAARAGATVDIHMLGLDELRRRGIPARFLPLGYVPEWDAWGGSDRERPIDVTFLGGYTERRGLALARCASVLSNYRTSLRLVETWRPHTADAPFFLSGEAKFRHLASSKVVLSAHREAYAYLEWQRALGATANGCVVLTEHSSGFAPLIPGEHFVSVAYASLPWALAGLLEDDVYLARIRSSAYDFIRSQMPLSESIAVLVEAIDEVGKQPVAAERRRAAPSVPAPKPLTPPVPEWERLQAEPLESRVISATMKRLVLAQRRLERRLAEMAVPVDGEAVGVQEYGPKSELAARITVALTVFNYAGDVGNAIRSVGLAAGDDTELVVVDDASTDESAEVVERVLVKEVPWLRATLLRCARNAGLPAARNLAIERGSGEYIFVLDADNLVYPHAFSRLREALDGDPGAAFAYGLLERFDAQGPVDLMSWIPWQPDRFKYGNYIDAMAMIRRTAFLSVGGYATDERIYGWEDFALWCAFAQADMEGVQVPEIVGRYRAGASSMISLTNIDTTDAWAYLIERFPFLRDQSDQRL